MASSIWWRGLRAAGRLKLRLAGSHRQSGGGSSSAETAPVLAGSEESDLPEKTTAKMFSALQSERHEQAERTILISCPPNISEKKFYKYLSSHGMINRYFFYETFVSVADQSLNVEPFIPDQGSTPETKGQARLRQIEEIKLGKLGTLFVVYLGPKENKYNSSRWFEDLHTWDVIDVPFQLPGHAALQGSRAAAAGFDVPWETRLAADESKSEDAPTIKESGFRQHLCCIYFQQLQYFAFVKANLGRIKMEVRDSSGASFDDALVAVGSSGVEVGTGQKISETGGAFSMEYQTKRVASERVATQSTLSVIAECIDQFAPGCTGMQKILNARCPLVRFSHQPSGFQCDLTANNRIAMRSTELLYIYSNLDPRVRALVFGVRSWARVQGITSSVPGAWITNFSLTMMVLFLLQKRSPPIIPTVDQLKDLAEAKDKYVIENHDCTFVSDYKIKPSQNTETLEELLQEFFEFYGTFAFNKMSINIRKGKEQNKPEASPLYIQNPFEQALNVSKNVNQTQLEKFVTAARESAWLLQQEGLKRPVTNTKPWGLAALLLPTTQPSGSKSKKKRRQPASERIRNLLDSLKTNKQISDNLNGGRRYICTVAR
uniref:poly(A) RNA polymerase, mitochondrial n=1 Tax=Pristiophorus japonicus TaxID=55135 RepID=UPI00398F2D80